MILQNFGVNSKSLGVFQEVLNMNLWKYYQRKQTCLRYSHKERTLLKQESRCKVVSCFFRRNKTYFTLHIFISQLKKSDLKMNLSKRPVAFLHSVFADYIMLPTFCK